MDDKFFGDLYKDIGMEIGNVVVNDTGIDIDDMKLSYEEYPYSVKLLNSSDCQIILWLKFLPDPKNPKQWNIIEEILRIGVSRNIIKRFTDIRSPISTPYYGHERRKIKPIRIF